MKSNQRKKTLQLEIGSNSLDALLQLCEDGRGEEFGIFRANETTLTFGQPFGHGESEGETLPDLDNSRTLLTSFQYSIDLRLSFDDDGGLDLDFALKGSGRRRKYSFRGLNRDSAVRAGTDFEQLLSLFLSEYSIYNLLWICNEKNNSRSNSRNRRQEVADKVLHNFRMFVSHHLTPKRTRLTHAVAKGGISISEYESVMTGRTPGKKGARQLSATERQRRSERLEKIVTAIRSAHNPENKTELSRLIGVSRQTLRKWLGEIHDERGQDFYALIRESVSH